MDGLKARLSFDAVAYDYDDEYLTIDTDTHIITINNLSRLFGVQYDGNSKLIKFRIRNQLSDIQKMQDSIVYINWIDSKGVKGQSIAINKTINNETCEFAWKVPFDALKNSRVLHFAMSAVITANGSSVINQKWSTQIASVIIPDGIYIKSYTPSSEEEDRIAQIYNELSKMINKQNDDLRADIDVERKRIDVLNNGGLIIKDELIENNIKTWLDEHPEATTTVQDGAITENKINTSFLPYIKKDYFTPEMFGAIGDGFTDDVIAIQKCLDVAKENKSLVFLNGYYAINKSIDLSGSDIRILGNGIIKYNGNEYAIHCHGLQNSYIQISQIISENGGGILFSSKDSTSDYNQYVTLDITFIKAKTICISSEKKSDGVSKIGWTNEIHIYNSRLSTFNYANGGDSIGIYIKSEIGQTNGWRLINVGFEDINKGIVLDNSIVGKDKPIEISVISPRTSENFDLILSSIGDSNIQYISENKYILKKWFNLSNTTFGEIVGRFCNNGYRYISDVCRISDGKFYPSTKLENISLSLGNVNLYDVDERTNGVYVTNFNATHDIKYTIKLNEYYGVLGINEFTVNVKVEWAGLTIVDANDNELVSISRLTPNSIYTFYFTSDKSIQYYCSFYNGTDYTQVSMPNENIVLTNCEINAEYTNNGYKRIGKIICVSIRVKAKSDSFEIRGLPKYDSNVSLVILNSNVGQALLTNEGVLKVTGVNAEAECIMSGTYFANNYA